MDLLGLGALGLVAAEWLGLGWLSRVDWPSDNHDGSAFWAPRWALRLLVGSVLVSLAQLVLAFVGVGFGSIPLVLAVAAVGAGVLRTIVGGAPRYEKYQGMSVRERAGWLLLGGVLVAATARSLLVPEAGWDAYSHWGLRAQAYALAANVVSANSEHEYYPPLVPLLEAWLYLHRGAVSIDLGKTIWALVGSAFSICLSWQLRLSLARPWLAPYFGTAIVLSTMALLDGFWTGQADLPLTAFLTLATLAVWQWHRQPAAGRMWLVQVAIFGAAAAFTKFEGFPRIGVVVAAVLLEAWLMKRRSLFVATLVLLAASGAAWLLWTAFELTHAIPANAEHLGPFMPQALGGVLVSLVAVFGGLRTGGALLVVILGCVVASRYVLREPLRLVSLVVLSQLAATLIAFLLSASGPELAVRTSATRLFEQFLPLALFATSIALGLALTAEAARTDGAYNRPGR